MQKPFFPTPKNIYREPESIRRAITQISREVRSKKPDIEEIVLFGSYSGGRPGYFSDLDLLIIVSQDSRLPPDRIPEFLFLFKDAPLPVDVFVWTREEYIKRSEKGDPFLQEIVQNGCRLA
ncbi:MAG: nucleotidyltransferase domain-containing protein [Planctomycetes bacterium]|nr:nucleotidyltransferase domain-containing protein [Planctomycetota bacterium]